MSDDYRKGAEAAAQDFPHNRLAARALGQLARNGLGLLPGAQAREAEFLEGYRDTHRARSSDAQRVHSVRTVEETAVQSGMATVSSGGFPMSSSQQISHGVTSQVASIHDRGPGGSTLGYASQVELLQELRAYLLRFEAGLAKAGADYQQKVAYLEGMMMREDHAEFTENHLAPALMLMHQLRELLMEESVPALERVIGHLQDTPRI